MAFNAKNATVETYTPLVYGINLKNRLLPFVNLNNEMKTKLGLRTFEDEPQYIFDKEDQKLNIPYKQAVLELYIQMKETEIPGLDDNIIPVRFYVDNIERPISGTNKFQFINNDGQTQWMESMDDELDTRFMEHKDGLRVALRGEADFVSALMSMLGVKKGIAFSDWKNVFNGNFSEIQNTIKDVQTWLKNDQKKPEKEFALLFYVASKTKTNDEGIEKTYFSQQVYLKAFNERGIRRQISKDEENGYMIKGIHKNEGIIMNYLTAFNPSDFKEEEQDDLPF